MSDFTSENKGSRTTMVPVTTMEEMPLLSEAERADMLASLKAAEADIAAGKYVGHDSETFVDHLLAIRNAAKNLPSFLSCRTTSISSVPRIVHVYFELDNAHIFGSST